jgi:hypothetical protein
VACEDLPVKKDSDLPRSSFAYNAARSQRQVQVRHEIAAPVNAIVLSAYEGHAL